MRLPMALTSFTPTSSDGDQRANAAADDAVLHAVLTTTQVMISELDPHAILQVLAEKIASLANVRAAAVFEYDDELSCLRVRSSFGLSKSYTRSISVAPIGSNGGAVGRAFQTWEMVLVTDIESDPSFMPNVRRRLEQQDLRGVLAAPLIAREKLLGVLAVYFPPGVSPTDSEVNTVRALANLAALALDNARAYQARVRASQEMESLYAQLAERSELLSRSSQIHNWLVRTVLTSDGLETTTNALAELAGARAVVEDSHMNLLCVSRAPSSLADSARLPADLSLASLIDDPRVRSVVRGIRSSGRPAHVPAIPEIGLTTERVTAPVFVGDALLGYVSILLSDRPLETLDYILCEQGAIAVALEMMKRKVAYEVEQKIRGDLLQGLLDGNLEDLGRAGSAVAGLRYDLHSLRRVLIVRLDSGEGAADGDEATDPQTELRSEVHPVVERILLSSCPKSMLVGRGDSLVVLLGGDDPIGDSAVVDLAERVVAIVKERLAPASVSIGIGRECRDPKELRDSYVDASRGLEVAEILGKRGAVISHADLGVYGILMRQSDPSELREFAWRYIEPLVEYDRAHNSGLIRTLESYVRNNYRLNDTADELIVHRNTVKYRLEKIEELSGSRLDDAESLMNLQLAFRIHQLMKGEG